MKELWRWLGIALGAIGAIFGLDWAKKKLEARGAAKQQEKQQQLADEIESELAESDARIDARSAEALEGIEIERLQLSEETRARLREAPTADEVRRLLDEAKE